MFALGDRTVIALAHPGRVPGDKPFSSDPGSGGGVVIELRDTTTGNVRKTLTLDGVVTGETWLGKPAIVVRGERVVPSDGLSRETSLRTVQAWDRTTP
ncbi:hypothetical protein [Embleya sp. NPDC020630]|uniref:hypothetical protein n=1 Tax=Embleya sp. NPDC020630 TaxID=3363979 RepID=UPI0037BDF6B6